MKVVRVLIIGAGMAGSTLALMLRQMNAQAATTGVTFSATIFEKAPHIAPIGAGICLAPNGLRLLDYLGVYTSSRSASPVTQAPLACGGGGGSNKPEVGAGRRWRWWPGTDASRKDVGDRTVSRECGDGVKYRAGSHADGEGVGDRTGSLAGGPPSLRYSIRGASGTSAGHVPEAERMMRPGTCTGGDRTISHSTGLTGCEAPSSKPSRAEDAGPNETGRGTFLCDGSSGSSVHASKARMSCATSRTASLQTVCADDARNSAIGNPCSASRTAPCAAARDGPCSSASGTAHCTISRATCEGGIVTSSCAKFISAGGVIGPCSPDHNHGRDVLGLGTGVWRPPGGIRFGGKEEGADGAGCSEVEVRGVEWSGRLGYRSAGATEGSYAGAEGSDGSGHSATLSDCGPLQGASGCVEEPSKISCSTKGSSSSTYCLEAAELHNRSVIGREDSLWRSGGAKQAWAAEGSPACVGWAVEAVAEGGTTLAGKDVDQRGDGSDNALPDLSEFGAELQRLHLWGPDAERLKTHDLSFYKSQYGYPMLLVERAHLQSTLLAHVEAVHPDENGGHVPLRLHRQLAEVDVLPDNAGVVARFADGTEAWGDVLIGADGVKSVVRQVLAERQRQKTTRLLEKGQCTTSPWSSASTNEALQQSRPHFSHMSIILGVTDPVSSIPEGDAHWVFGRGRFYGTWSMARQRQYWFMLQEEDFSVVGAKEFWRAEDGRSLATDLFRHAGPHPYDVDEVARQTLRTVKIQLSEVEPGCSWAEGPVAVMGDAAHAMLPSSGQGANMAIEDAAVLARCLAGHPYDISQALLKYEGQRRSRVDGVLHYAHFMNRVQTIQNPLLAAVRHAAIRMMPAALFQRLACQFYGDVEAAQ